MMERIAAALEIDSPALFSTKSYPSDTEKTAKKFQELVIADIEKVISARLKELEQGTGLT
jgi:hypothetical protein